SPATLGSRLRTRQWLCWAVFAARQFGKFRRPTLTLTASAPSFRLRTSVRPPNSARFPYAGGWSPSMRRTLVALLTAATLLGVAACNSNESAGGNPASGPDKVNVGVIPIVDVAPIYLGKQQGFFSNRNIDLNLQLA